MHVRCWHLADIGLCYAYVCCCPKADIAPASSRLTQFSKSIEQAGTIVSYSRLFIRLWNRSVVEACMNGIIYLIGLIVVIMAILSFLGLR